MANYSFILFLSGVAPRDVLVEGATGTHDVGAPIIDIWPEVPEENMRMLMDAASKYER